MWQSNLSFVKFFENAVCWSSSPCVMKTLGFLEKLFSHFFSPFLSA